MSPTPSLPAGLDIQRAQTQKNVNRQVLTTVAGQFATHDAFRALDLPCGNLEFLTYLRTLFPQAALYGADIVRPAAQQGIEFVQMDLTKSFTLPANETFDLITSISGIMMFSNTLSFIENCVARLKKGGRFIITNDNSATIIDRLAYLFAARYRLFRPVYDDTELLTENVPVQEVCRLLRTHGIVIDSIEYVSFYAKDSVYLPAALVVYPLQRLYLARTKTALPDKLIKEMYPFRHLFCKHYIISGHKA